jgi:hypothetical protein
MYKKKGSNKIHTRTKKPEKVKKSITCFSTRRKKERVLQDCSVSIKRKRTAPIPPNTFDRKVID